MAVSCYHVQQLLSSAWFNLTLELDNLPPRVSLITSSADHPKKTKSKINVHSFKERESEVSNHKDMVSKLITSKEQILANYADVFDEYWMLSQSPIPHTCGSQCHTKANPLLTNPCSFERSFWEGDWQDVTSRSSEACEPSNYLDQQFCSGRGQG